MIDCFCLFCFHMFELFLLIQKMTCFLSASVKVKLSPLSVLCYMTLMLVVNKNALLAFHSVCHVLFRDKTRRLGYKML